ncbi:MAG: two-component sensor histidine kinase [Caulobacter vibrioides]|uniref:histidine kinase n=1 Tax=Caulobacter vibrioides TaxID=155892 RepID=A0A258D6W7_CAUVI|nr:MAG: two-component sensor histidine kinase [Caulobacter vibrioides]
MVQPGSPSEDKTPKPRKRFPWPGGLSARLLLFTAVVVNFGGLLILPPALAAYEEQWLLDRVRAGELASTIAESDPELRVSDAVANQMFDQAGAVTVAVQVDGARRLVLPPKQPFETPYLVDLRRQNPGSWLAAPFYTLTSPKGAMVRVMAEPRFRKAEFIEVVLPDAPLKARLVAYFWQLAGVTIFVATLAGVLVYAFLNIFLVRPMQRITLAMEAFRSDPDDPAARIALSNRRDEIGRAELELDRMQADLLAALASKARLAALGEAVAKINHDLRNMLTSAQMASDRLAALGDPKVAQALPRLERALDRAINLASDVMAYGKSKEPEPVTRVISLRPALDMAAEDAGLSTQGVSLETVIGPREQVLADPDQLHRILTNLLRNAREAIEGAPDRGGKGKVFVELRRTEGSSILRLSDDGPGVPERARTNLFQPFVGSVRRGGTGLGLAIARELAQGHGGDLALVETGPGGSVFDLTLAGAPEPLPEPDDKAADASAG